MASITLEGTPEQLHRALSAFLGEDEPAAKATLVEDAEAEGNVPGAAVASISRHAPESSKAELTRWLDAVLGDNSYGDPYESKDKNLPGATLWYPSGPIRFGALFCLDPKRNSVTINIDDYSGPNSRYNGEPHLRTRVDLRSEGGRQEARQLIDRAYKARNARDSKRGRS